MTRFFTYFSNHPPLSDGLQIYVQLGILYNTTFLNKDISKQSEKYIRKALKVLNVSDLFSKNPDKKEMPINYLARHRLRLSEVYITFEEYDKAEKEGLNELLYIFEHKLDNSSHEGFLKAQASFNKAEILLRKNNLDKVEKHINEPLYEIEKLLGSSHTLVPKILLAEAKIRLKKFNEAYKDCRFVFNLKRKERSNYLDLMYITTFYHAAIIKYKQNDPQKSAEHFADFIKQMREFCKGFLGEKEYKVLESKGVFIEIDLTKALTKEDIKQYLSRSTQIFRAIYGSDHPFVKDYVMKNKESNRMQSIDMDAMF